MKKILKKTALFLFAFVLLIPQFFGCAPKEVEQTNKELKIAYFGSSNSLVSNSLEVFKQKYPDVEVTLDYQPYTDADPVGENFFTRISTEIMGGKGPDLILLGQWGMNGNKMMRSGAFVNLNDFIENDPTFDLSKYNQNILKAGQVDSKQYIMPLAYSIPLVCTTQELLDKTGFDISTTNNYNTFLNECSSYLKNKSGSSPNLAINMYIKPYLSDCANYDTGEVNFDTPENRETIRLNREVISSKSQTDGYGTTTFGAPLLIKEKSLFSLSIMPLEYHILNYRALKSTATPVQTPLYDAYGRLMAEITDSVAINANSPNQKNAYEFLKLILNDENSSFVQNIHISNDVVKKYLESFMGKEEPLNLTSTDGSDPSGGITTLSGLEQKDIDQYMHFLEEIDGAYLQEIDIIEAHSQTINAYYREKTNDLDTCIQEMESKLKILVNE